MRRTLIGTACLVLLTACALLGAQARDGAAKLRLRLIDAMAGKNTGGIVRVWAGANALDLAGLLPRLRGVQPPPGAEGWFVVPEAGAEIALPRGQLRLEAVAGLETGRAQLDLDLAQKLPEEIVVKLETAFRPEDHGLVAGNTH